MLDAQRKEMYMKATEFKGNAVLALPVTRVKRNVCGCLECGDIIESLYRHHFVQCSCGKLFTDGGKDYIRRGYNDESLVLDLTEYETVT